MGQNREARDAAGIGPYAQERERLVALSTLDSWTVSDGEPDIRGWEVKTVSGRQLGVVHELLVDEGAQEVVLLDVDLPGTDQHTFVPIRIVQIDRAKRIVVMDSADMPEAGVPRGPLPADRRSTGEATTVRYRQSDRQVEMAPATRADDARLTGRPNDAIAPANRQQLERRRIERLSTDL